VTRQVDKLRQYQRKQNENPQSTANTKRKRHGMSGMPEYRIWKQARARCNSPRNKDYALYGGRGIEFRFDTFRQFFNELGARPEGASLDRFPNNDGHYEAGNVRWATWTQQRLNQRTRKLPPFKDIEGRRFGRLTAVRPTDKRLDRKVVWECLCDCGVAAYVSVSNLCRGDTRSCGCLLRETRAKKKNRYFSPCHMLSAEHIIGRFKRKHPALVLTTPPKGPAVSMFC
jgi:hypothetical protein